MSDEIDNPDELNEVQKRVLYLDQYVGGENLIRNTGNFSQREVTEAREIVENCTFSADEIEKEIKKRIKTRLAKLFRRDEFYLTVLEHLKISCKDQGEKFVIDQKKVEEFSNERQEELGQYISDLISEGLVLKTIDTYQITPELVSVLQDFEKRSRTESYPLSSEEQAAEILNGIFHRATNDILLVDTYFDEKALDLIHSTVPKTQGMSIRILRDPFKGNNDPEGELEEKLSEYRLDQIYDVKTVSNRGDLPHDRFIILDNSVAWQSGHSFNHIGGSFCTLFSHSSENSDEIMNHLENIWNNANSMNW